MIRCRYIGVGVILLFCGIVQEARCQDMTKVDSLRTLLADNQGKERAGLLWELAKLYIDKQNGDGVALEYVSEAYELSRQAPVDSLTMVKMARRKAMVLHRLERYQEVFAVINDVLPIAQRGGFEDEISLCLSILGQVYGLQGKYDKALITQMKALGIREKLRDTLDISVTQNNIGLVYYKMNNYTKALDYYFKSIRSKQAVNTHHDEDLAYINIALCYRYVGKTDLALYYVKKSLGLCDNMCGTQVALNGTFVLGLIYMDIKQPEKARRYLLQCYETAVRTGNRRFQSESMVVLARNANNAAQYQMALDYCGLSEKNALSVGSVNMAAQTYYEFFRAMRGLCDYKNAALYWDKYVTKDDSVFNETMSYGVVSAQLDFEQERNRLQLALQESTLQWQKRRNLWITVIAGLLMVVVTLLIYDYHTRKRESKVLERMIGERTATLAELVRTLEHKAIALGTWEEKTERALYTGRRRLEALGNMVNRESINAGLNRLREAR